MAITYKRCWDVITQSTDEVIFGTPANDWASYIVLAPT